MEKLQHNFFECENDRTLSVVKICDNPITCDVCDDTLKKLNILRFEDYLNEVKSNHPIHTLSFDILPTSFFIGFQNFKMIELIFEKLYQILNQRGKKEIITLDCLMTTFTTNEIYYNYPVLQIQILFFGKITENLRKQLTEFGNYKIPLLSGDIGVFETYTKELDDLKIELGEKIYYPKDDLFELFEDNKYNIYGTRKLREELRFMTIYHIHPIDLKLLSDDKFEIETFKTFHHNNLIVETYDDPQF
jgi:hypothetical protein